MNFECDVVDENGETVIQLDSPTHHVKTFLQDTKTFIAVKYSINEMPTAPPPGTFEVFESYIRQNKIVLFLERFY